MVQTTGERDALLLERDRELQRTAGFLQRAQQGHGGALVVEGPAGIGKTVLLAASRDLAEGEGFRVLRARGAELEREFAFGVVRQLIESVVAGASEDERAWLLDGPPGVAAQLLGLPGLGGATKAAVAPDPSFAVLHGLYWLCANLATERPLALVVDDAHWVDGASLRFLAFLLPRLEELHIAVLLGARPAEAGERRELLAALTMDPATEVVTVGPLTTNGVATLVAAGLGVEPEPEFVQACWEATGGTPFLVRTLVEALREERIAPVAASAGNVLNGVAATTLARWALLRLVQLGPDAARMARAVAVLERAELDQAAQLAGLALLDAARAADLLVQAGVLDEASLDFAHPLLRGVVYRDMAMAERADAHGQAARLLADVHASPGRVAEHLLATFPAGDGWVVEQLRAASQVALARGAPESATAYLRRALAEPPSSETRPYLLLELGLSEFNASESGWHEHLEDAVESASDDTIRIAATVVLAHALVFHQRLADAVEVCDRVAERIEVANHRRSILRCVPWRLPSERLTQRSRRSWLTEQVLSLSRPQSARSLAKCRRWPDIWPRWRTGRPTKWLIWPAEPSPPACGRCPGQESWPLVSGGDGWAPLGRTVRGGARRCSTPPWPRHGQRPTEYSFAPLLATELALPFGGATSQRSRPTRALFSMPQVCSLNCLPVLRRASSSKCWSSEVQWTRPSAPSSHS